MKKKLAYATLALILIAGTAPALAEESTTVSGTAAANAATSTGASTTNTSGSASAGASTTTTVPTVDPDSFLYKLKEFFMQIQLAFTFKNQAKADRLIQQANTKIAELQALNQSGKTEYNEKYIQTINEILEKAQQLLQQAKIEAEQKQDPKAKTEIEQKESAELEVEKHSLTVLKGLLEKVPEQGKKGIENAIAKQEAKLKSKAEAQAAEPAPVPQPIQPETKQAADSQANATSSGSVSSSGTVHATGKGNANANANKSFSSGGSVNVQMPALDEAGVTVKQNSGLHLGATKQQEPKAEKDKKENGR